MCMKHNHMNVRIHREPRSRVSKMGMLRPTISIAACISDNKVYPQKYAGACVAQHHVYRIAQSRYSCRFSHFMLSPIRALPWRKG